MDADASQEESNNSLLKRVGVVSALLFLGICLFTVGWLTSENVRFDGRTFLIAANRILEGEWDELYDPLIGSGPWAYPPTAVFFFIPYVLLGDNAGFRLLVLSNALALWTIVFLVCSAARGPSHTRVGQSIFGILIIPSLFWFVIWENFFMGQIDSILAATLLGAFVAFSRGRLYLAGFLLAVPLCFKPQMGLFLLLMLALRGSKPVLIAVSSLTGATFAILIWSSLDVTTAVILVDKYHAVASAIVSQGIGPVNQSLHSITGMWFSGLEYPSRFDPQWYVPRMLNYKVTHLPTFLVSTIVWAGRALALGLLLYCWRRLPKPVTSEAILGLFCLALTTLPWLSPVYWQIHTVYALPAFGWIYFRLLNRGSHRDWTFLAFAGLVLASANPIVLGPQGADLVQSYGAYFWVNVVLMVLTVSDFRKSSIDTVKYN